MISRHQLIILARQHPFCAGCCALSGVLVLVSGFLWLQSRALATRHHKRQAEGEAVLAIVSSAPQLRQELAFARETLRRVQENLVSEDDLSDSVNYFYRMEEQSKARLEEFNPLTAPAPDDDALYKRVPFNLRVSGTYAQIIAFVHAIESGPRLASVTYFSFRRRAPGSPVIVLDMNLDLLGKR